MQQNELKITIDKSIEEVFEFTINPNNTHKWIKSMLKEKTSSDIIKKGVIYKNTSDNITWDEYIVTSFEENSLFELKSGSYGVRYTYNKVNDKSTTMTYFEWDDKGISDPFTIETLEALKKIMES